MQKSNFRIPEPQAARKGRPYVRLLPDASLFYQTVPSPSTGNTHYFLWSQITSASFSKPLPDHPDKLPYILHILFPHLYPDQGALPPSPLLEIEACPQILQGLVSPLPSDLHTGPVGAVIGRCIKRACKGRYLTPVCLWQWDILQGEPLFFSVSYINHLLHLLSKTLYCVAGLNPALSPYVPWWRPGPLSFAF